MNDQPLILYDRSRVVTDWKCPRARYWNYEYNGKGITTASTPLELFMGITLHDALAALAILTKAGKPVDIDLLATTAFTQMKEYLLNVETSRSIEDQTIYANEQATLTEGLFRGFCRVVWPRLLEAYPTILYTEEELTYSHDGLCFMSKPDLVLQNDATGERVYVEYKSTSSKKPEWITSWETAVQLHSTLKAIEATHGVTVDGVIIQGLYKGYLAYNKQTSPFCYGYRASGTPPFTSLHISYEYKPGWKKFPVWEMEGGCKRWVEEMPEELLIDQFPQTPTIMINKDLVEKFFKQRGIRENEIAAAMKEQPLSDDTMNNVFPQRFDQCRPSFGRGCQYQLLCHGHVDNPLDAGYIYRTPHHEGEAEQFAEEP